MKFLARTPGHRHLFAFCTLGLTLFGCGNEKAIGPPKGELEKHNDRTNTIRLESNDKIESLRAEIARLKADTSLSEAEKTSKLRATNLELSQAFRDFQQTMSQHHASGPMPPESNK